MSQSNELEDWHWTVTFATTQTDLVDLEPQQIWSAMWTRMSHAHRYISKPELKLEHSEDAGKLIVSSIWRSMHKPDNDETETLEQTPGCYLAWYKNQEQWTTVVKRRELERPPTPIDAPW
ncbi:hypothetical protein ACK9YZ_05370 [Rhizobium sp. ZK1]|uniref:hypothetical protein n=1 Tax=Rhizobium sp. ZK1 TaxID=3389872 RepID=UPI0039F70023